MADSEKPDSKCRRFVLPFLLAAACLAVYANSIHNDFLQDDVYNITQNTFIREPSQLPKLLSRDYFRLAQEGAYRPVPTALLVAEYALWGYKVEGYRAVNLGWHLLATLLLFWLSSRLLERVLDRSRARTAAFLGALLFAVHPAHSQMISVISYHEDLVCFVFVLASMHLYLSRRLAPSLACFVAALFSKEMAVTLPAVLVLYHLFFDPVPLRRRDPRVWASLATFFGLSALFALGRFTLFKPVGMMMEADASAIAHWPGLAESLRNALGACVVYARYVGLLAWPSKLSVDWDSVLIHEPASAAFVVASAALVGALGLLALGQCRRRPWLSFGVLYFLVTLLPVSGIVPFWSSMAERYLYIPSWGLFLVAGWALERLCSARRSDGARSFAAAAVLLAPAALACRTVLRNRDYKDEPTMYRREVEVHPRSYGAWYGLGFALGKSGDYAGAKEAFLKSAEFDAYHKTHFMLGFVEEKLKGPAETVEREYRQAIALEPKYYPAHFNLGVLLQRRGELDGAIASYETAVRLNPHYKEARANLGAAYLARGRPDMALKELTRALGTSSELDTSPEGGLDAKIEYNLASALFQLDRGGEAMRHYRRSLALDPKLADKPLRKPVASAAGRMGVPPMLTRLRARFPQLSQNWEAAERLRYAASPEGFRPETGYAGSAQTPEELKPQEKAALASLARRHGSAARLEISIPMQASGKLVLDTEKVRTEQTMLAARPAVGTPEHGLLRYPDAYPQSDLLYIADGASVEQLLFLKDPSAPTRFQSSIEVRGGTLRRKETGEISIHDRAGKRRLGLTRPLILDAAGRVVSGRWEVSTRPVEGGRPDWKSYSVVLAFEPSGLEYPLLVDPIWGNFLDDLSLLKRVSFHTATILPNGKVLVSGGYDVDASFNRVPRTDAQLYDFVSGSKALTGSMSVPRVGHTATLLASGKVLVAGGFSGGGYPTASELYDPASGNWSATGSLSTARFRHTATLLANGKVLVAGGFDGNYLRTAELYDPATGAWSETGPMATGRLYHNATLLSDGKVLAAGGEKEDFVVKTGELFDPSVGTWSGAGALLTSRSRHSATLLVDGKVLVAGGNGTVLDIPTAELYDPATRTWSASGSLSTGRAQHSATRLPDGRVFVVGGWSSLNWIPTAEVYDPASGVWEPNSYLGTGRGNHTATILPNGSLMMAGGDHRPTGSLDYPIQNAEFYHPLIADWSPAGSLATARYYHTATLLPNGKVLAAGGFVTSQGTFSAEVYDPSADSWTPTGSMASARYWHTATLLPTGRVLVTGGTNATVRQTAELFDPDLGSWSTAAPMSVERNVHTATILPNGHVLVVGGRAEGGLVLSSAEAYDPVSDRWSAAGSMASARYLHTATLLESGKVLVVGGIDATTLPTAELYDPTSGSWSVTSSLASARYYHSATLTADGKVLVAGGVGGTGTLETVEIYDPALGTWSTMNCSGCDALQRHTATLLPNGKVLVAGGRKLVLSNLVDTSFTYLYHPAMQPGIGIRGGSFLNTVRVNHAATLLPNGEVLIVGGYNGTTGALTDCERALYTDYEFRLSTMTAARPQVLAVNGSSTFPVNAFQGTLTTVTGNRFTGLPTPYGDELPRAYLRAVDSGGNLSQGGSRLVDVTASIYENPWSATELSFRIPYDVAPGYYLFWVQSNAVPSEAKILVVPARPAPSLTIQSIAPNSGTQGAAVDFTITGTGFEPNAYVKLTKAGSPDISATNLVVSDAGRIEGRFDLSNAAGGLRNVVVADPGVALVQLSGGFTVVPKHEDPVKVFHGVFDPASGEAASVSCKLAAPGRVTVKVFDRRGRFIRSLYEGDRSAGVYLDKWDGKNESGSTVASGIYLIRVEGPGVSLTKRVLVAK